MKSTRPKRKSKPRRESKNGEPVGIERVGQEASQTADEDEIAIELPVEQNDHNAQTS